MSDGMYVGMGKGDHSKIKGDIKSEIKQLKKEKQLKEKQEKAQAKIQAKEEKERRRKEKKDGKRTTSSSSLIDASERPEGGGSFFGLHFDQGGCGDDAISFLSSCIRWLEEEDRMMEKGVYRMNGSHSNVVRLKAAFLENPNYTIEPSEEVHSVTGVLKLYLREMPEPLIPFKLYDSFIAAASEESDSTDEIRKLISFLPSNNRRMFAMLLNHLHKLSQFSSQNLMGESNVAIVFAPNLLRPEVETPEVILGDARSATTLFMNIIRSPSQYFADRVAQPATNSNGFDYDAYILSQGLDPLAVANYISHFISQGLTEENAKSWAVYYLCQNQTLNQPAAATAAPSQPVIHTPSPEQTTPVSVAAASSSPSDGLLIPSHSNPSIIRRSTFDQPREVPSVPVPRSPSQPTLSLAASATQRALPDPSSPVSPRTGGPPSRAPPLVSPQVSPTVNRAPRARGPPPPVASTGARLRPPPPSTPENGSQPPARPHPPSGKATESRLANVRRARTQSIALLRNSVGGNDKDFNNNMQRMMEAYRNGDSSVLDRLK